MPTPDEHRVVVCDMGAVNEPDLATIEALARIEMSVRSLGYRLWLRNPPGRLTDLIDICGMEELLAWSGDSALEDEGEAKQGEQPLGVEEEVETGDPPA